MRAMKTIVLMCLCGVASVAPAKDSLKARLKAHAEQAVMAMLPTNAVNEAAGFFGPVTKKYLPVLSQRYSTRHDSFLCIPLRESQHSLLFRIYRFQSL